MMAAGLAFSVMITLVKIARVELGPVEVVFWRAFASLPFAIALVWGRSLRVHNVRLLALRCALGLVAVFCFFTAAKQLMIADISLLSQLQPLAIAAIAPIALGAAERPGRLVWSLMLVGFAGCALILAPDLALGSIYGFLAVAGALCSAGAHICLRGLSRSDRPRVVVFHFHLVMTVVALVIMVVDSGELPIPPVHLLPHLIGIGFSASLGQMLMTHAYAEDRVSVVAAARYSSPVWGVLIDLTIFVVVPGWHVLVGGGLIVGAGLILVFLPTGRPAGRPTRRHGAE